MPKRIAPGLQEGSPRRLCRSESRAKIRTDIINGGCGLTDQTKQHVKDLVFSIRSRQSNLITVAEQLRTPEIRSAFDQWDCNAWCHSVAGDALVRIRLFTEQNFNFIEPMGLLATARYLFELSVWLNLFNLDRRYGLVYFGQLLDGQRRYYEDTKAQHEREIALLRSFAEMEEEAHAKVLDGLTDRPVRGSGMQSFGQKLKSVSEQIDVEASRKFSIYVKDAQINGYAFQAHCIESKAIPQIEQALADISCKKKTFDTTVPKEVKALIPKRWQWRQMAQKVGLVDEYDYIYSFSSKLLHATPSSVTTDQKNLEMDEMLVFLKYIDVKIDDIIVLAKEYC